MPYRNDGWLAFEFYQKVSAFLSDFLDNVLLHGYGVGCDNLSCDIYFIKKYRYGLYLVALFPDRLRWRLLCRC